MKKYSVLLICSIAAQLFLHAQDKIGAELYTYFGVKPTIQPLVHFQANSNWYGELRYNYEDLKTVSLYGGKTFSGGSNFEYSITPMIGYSTGRFTGLSLAFNAEAEWKSFYLSSQTQHSIATRKNDPSSVKKSEENFFFSWSELGYQPLRWMYAGVSLQHTQLYKTTASLEPGVLLGFSVKQWSIPIYGFNVFGSEQYFVVGVNWEWKKGVKSKSNPPVLSYTNPEQLQEH